MTKVALILPVSLLKTYGHLSRYHLVMPHAYQEYPAYRDFYKNRSEAGDEILLDNGAPEGGLKPNHELIEIVKDLQPSQVFLPDAIRKGRETLNLSIDLMMELKEGMGDDCPLLIGVPQGESIDEWDECFNAFNRHPDIDILGISKYYPKAFHTREQCLRHVTRRIKKPVHLLGLSDEDGLLEPLVYDGTIEVNGIDSAHFYLLARYYYSRTLHIDGGTSPVPPITSWVTTTVSARGKELQKFDEMTLLCEEEFKPVYNSLRQLVSILER